MWEGAQAGTASHCRGSRRRAGGKVDSRLRKSGHPARDTFYYWEYNTSTQKLTVSRSEPVLNGIEMDINASIIDQRVNAVADTIRERARGELGISDADRLKSLAFAYLCVQTILDLEEDAAFDCLTEGSGDFGVDAIHLTEEIDGEFTICLLQSKYKRALEGTTNFPEAGINSLIHAIRYIFDPNTKLEYINARLQAKVEEARSLIRDGYIPQVRALACNNGQRWHDAADQSIQHAAFGRQVTWEHINHDTLVKIIQGTKPVDDSLQLSGLAFVEDMNFSRVLVGRISVKEIAALIERHGERLLERNIRRYLGLQGNRVNEAIKTTLIGPEKGNFYFYNNGITLTCDKFDYNALQKSDYQVRIKNLQIINGGQTCLTIYRTLRETLDLCPEEAYVLVRLYQLPSDNEDLVRRITFATNSQNPVDLRDLKANDEKQQTLELDIQQLGYTYRRKRSDQAGKHETQFTSGTAAEAILSVWRQAPHQAKFFTREHFGRLYDHIFSDALNGAQTIIAVLLYRIAEERRRRPDAGDPPFVRYASCFAAMQMGRRLLSDMALPLEKLNHTNFNQAHHWVEQNGIPSFNASLKDIENALTQLYGRDIDTIPMQQLSATFRRGDLVQTLAEL